MSEMEYGAKESTDVSLKATSIHSNEENGSVPIDDLRALVEKWRYEYELPAGSAGQTEVAKAFEKCVDDVEAVIENNDR